MRRVLLISITSGVLLGPSIPAHAQEDGVYFDDGPADGTYAIPHERARGESGGGGGSSRSGSDDGSAAPFGAGVERGGGGSGGPPGAGAETTDPRSGRAEREGGSRSESAGAVAGRSVVATEAVNESWTDFPGLGWFLVLLAVVAGLGAAIARLLRRGWKPGRPSGR